MNRGKVKEAIKEVLEQSPFEDVFVHLNFGIDVESNLSGMSLWRQGRLCFHWLSMSDDSFKVRGEMDHVRKAIEALSIVDHVDVEPYMEESDELGETAIITGVAPQVGERWEITFNSEG